mgnify:CR=1 FL=1
MNHVKNQLLNALSPFWLISLSIVFGLTLPILIQDAMFQDAMLYSSVSHNLSMGIGTFWFLQYSTLNLEGIPSFHEQPPLVFGIQSIFYKLLGHSYYVERFYTLLMIVFHILLINYLWKTILRNKVEYKSFGWLPVFLWIIIPVCFWSFRNNMIENTVSVFTLISVILSYKSIQLKEPNYFAWFGSGFFIFLASFSKGIPGFFPITFPFIYWLVNRDISFKKCIYYSLILIAVPAIIYVILLYFPESRRSLMIYFYERLIKRVNHMPTANYRLEILWRLFTEMIPILIIVTITIFASGKNKLKDYLSENKKLSVLFFCIGMSGSVPLTLTMVQKGWYMVPSFPYFALSFALLIVPFIYKPISKWNMQSYNYKTFVFVSILVFVSVLIFSGMQKGKISREQDIVTDVYKVGSVVPRFSTITVPLEMYDQYDFILQGFLVRYFNISISPYQQYRYYLKEKDINSKVPNIYRKVDMDLINYDLFVQDSVPR